LEFFTNLPELAQSLIPSPQGPLEVPTATIPLFFSSNLLSFCEWQITSSYPTTLSLCLTYNLGSLGSPLSFPLCVFSHIIPLFVSVYVPRTSGFQTCLCKRMPTLGDGEGAPFSSILLSLFSKFWLHNSSNFPWFHIFKICRDGKGAIVLGFCEFGVFRFQGFWGLEVLKFWGFCFDGLGF
jgi:hypothetical protein